MSGDGGGHAGIGWLEAGKRLGRGEFCGSCMNTKLD